MAASPLEAPLEWPMPLRSRGGELHKAAHWCVRSGCGSRVVSSLGDGAVELEYYDAKTHGIRQCFWDAYAQAVRADRTRTLRAAAQHIAPVISHSARSHLARRLTRWTPLPSLVSRLRRSSMPLPVCRRHCVLHSGRCGTSSTSSQISSSQRSRQTSCGATSASTTGPTTHLGVTASAHGGGGGVQLTHSR